MARNDAPPGTRTTELLPPLPAEFVEALAASGVASDPADVVPEPQDAPPLRWGILGAGYIAGRFAADVPAFSSGSVVAVGSRDASRARAFIDARPGMGKGDPVRAHGAYEDLVADEAVEAVYIATPHSFHAEQAVLALEAGKPVLVEKSFALNAAQARRVLERARALGLFAMEAMWTRFLPGQVLARTLISSGALGELRHVRAEHFQSLLHVERLVRPELAGGALLDLGVYPLNFIHSLLGAPEAMEVVGRLAPQGIDLHEVVAMHYAQATAVACSGMDCAGPNPAQVIGTRGRLAVDTWFYGISPVSADLYDGAGRGPVVWDARVPGHFQYEAAEVARCVAEGRTQSSVMPWSATIEVMEMMDWVRSRLGVVYPGE